MLVDTHVHFDLLAPRAPPETVIARAAAAGVEKMIAVGGSAAANQAALRIAAANPHSVRASLGFDRQQAGLNPPIDELEKALGENCVAAIGEIGLDFHPNRKAQMNAHTPIHQHTAPPPERPGRDAQISLFRRMLELARDRRKPVIIHNREADEEIIAILAEHARAWPGPAGRIGVMHCFTGSKAFAERVLELGFSISFSGIITFNKSDRRQAGLIEAARAVPDERLLIETDSPFLAPVPLRGQANEPANLPHIAQALAALRNCSLEAIAAITTRNAERMFFDEM